jgi:hypothetical protein
MASLRKEIATRARAEDVWEAMRDVGALHTRLVPGFVIDTRLEPGARMVTFGNGTMLRELIVTVDDRQRRIVWSAVGGLLSHHNGSAQVVEGPNSETKIVWIADFLPDQASGAIERMMEEGLAAMKTTLDRLAENV